MSLFKSLFLWVSLHLKPGSYTPVATFMVSPKPIYIPLLFWGVEEGVFHYHTHLPTSPTAELGGWGFCYNIHLTVSFPMATEQALESLVYLIPLMRSFP